jgi:hypothetical protein
LAVDKPFEHKGAHVKALGETSQGLLDYDSALIASELLKESLLLVLIWVLSQSYFQPLVIGSEGEEMDDQKDEVSEVSQLRQLTVQQGLRDHDVDELLTYS